MFIHNLFSRFSPLNKGNGTLWARNNWGNYKDFVSKYYDNELITLGYDTYSTQASTGFLGYKNDNTPKITQVGTKSWKKVSIGRNHALAIDKNDRLWAWGPIDGTYIRFGIVQYIDKGQVGYNIENKRNSFIVLNTDFNNISYLSDSHIIKSDGTLWTWGNNYLGESGRTDITFGFADVNYNYRKFYSPVQIGTDTDWKELINYDDHNFGIKSDGSLYGWGNSWYGELGTGKYGSHRHGYATQREDNVVDQFVEVKNINRGDTRSWVSVSANYGNCSAMKSDGSIWTWGANFYGNVGNNADVQYFYQGCRSVPVQLGLDSWNMISAGGQLYFDMFSLAIKKDGTLWSWGGNTNGQLGLGLRSQGTYSQDRSSPTQIGTDSDWAYANAGCFGAVAIKTNGTLWTWGANYTGELGQGVSGGRVLTLTQVPGSWSFVQIARYSTIGIRTNGTLWSWGANYSGELGQGDKIARSSPVQIGTDTWKSVEIGYHTVGVKTNGTLWAWGNGSYGALGRGVEYESRSSPVQIGSDTDWNWVKVGSGCAVACKTDGSLWAWGYNYYGQFGISSGRCPLLYDQTQSILTPIKIGPSGRSFVSASLTGKYAFGPAFPESETLFVVDSTGKMWSCGWNAYGELGTGSNGILSPTRIGTSYWNKVKTGYNITAGIQTNGTLWAWGSPGYHGALCTGNIKPSLEPIQISSYNDWIDCDVNPLSVVGIRSDGSLWASGKIVNDNPYVRNSYLYRKSFGWSLDDSSLWNDFYATDSKQAFGLKTNGSLWVWGRNQYGQLGLGDRIHRSSPVQLGTSSWTSISASGGHYNETNYKGCTVSAIRNNGSLWSWGNNYYGQLGQGDLVHRSSPVQIGTSSWTISSSGSDFISAIRSDGSLWAWGVNNFGQLGQGDIINKSSPVQVGTSSWSSISSGYDFILALKPDATLWAWGRNDRGVLGQGDVINRSSPVQIGTSSWSFISAGVYHNLGIKLDGTLWSWGNNGYGQLGQGDQIYTTSPVLVGALLWNKISQNYNHTVATKTDGTLWTWGNNDFGQLGLGDRIHRSSPVQIGTSSWTSVSAGYLCSAAITIDKKLYLWGQNYYGSLGQGDQLHRSSPVQVGGSWNSVSVASYHTLAINSNGSLWSWGQNFDGELGDSGVDRSSPVQVGSFLWSFIFACRFMSSGIRSDGSLWTWGSNYIGNLGHGDKTNRFSPVQVGTSSWNLITIGGDNHSVLAIRSDKTLWAWGENGVGQLGLGDTNRRSSPVQVGTSSWSSVSASRYNTRAIKPDGTLWVWGLNGYGELGQGDKTHRSSPVQLGSLTWRNLSFGNNKEYLSAIRYDGTLWTLGANYYGELGQGDLINRSSPVQIGTEVNNNWSKCYADGVGQSVAIKTDGTLWGWGYNRYGQLGQNDTIHRSLPVQIGSDNNWLKYCTGKLNSNELNTYNKSKFFAGIKTNNELYMSGWNIMEDETGTRNIKQIDKTQSWTLVNFVNENVYTPKLSLLSTDKTLWEWNYTKEVSPKVIMGGMSWNAVYADTSGYNNTILGIDFNKNLWDITNNKIIWNNVNRFIKGGRSVYDINSNIVKADVPLPKFLTSSKDVYIDTEKLISDKSWSAISATKDHSLAIRSDGSLWVWGDNGNGQLGIGVTFNQINDLTPFGTRVKSLVTSKGNTSLVINPDATLSEWGNNSNGQLGQGDTIHRSSPVQVGSTIWSRVYGGSTHTIGVTTSFNSSFNTDLLTWGNNSSGQLGQDDRSHRSSPALVSLSQDKFSKIFGSMAIKPDGSLWVWGRNTQGQLGLGDIINKFSPIQLGTSSWNSVSSGRSHTVAIKSDGTLWTWGYSLQGQLGIPGLPDFTVYASPIQIGTSTWTMAVASRSFGRYTLAIRSDGSLWSWGRNNYGQLGQGDTINRSSPVQIGTSSWTMISINDISSFAIRSDGSLWSWGYNYFGSLGQGDRIHRSSPVQIGTSSWIAVDSSRYGPMAIKTDGSLWSWGNNTYGQLGQGDRINRSSPVQIGTSSWSSVASGTDFISAIKLDGTLWSWGRNNYGQLGQGDTINRSSPVQVGTYFWSSVSSGLSCITAIRIDKSIWRWGSNNYGQLGLNDTSFRVYPSTLRQNLIKGDASSETSYFIDESGRLYSCGNNTYGQLGQGDRTHRSSPSQVPGNYSWSSVSAGVSNVVALRIDGTLWTWGSNIFGELGLSSFASRSSPVQIGSSYWTSISSGLQHSLAIRVDGTLWGWGWNSSGNLAQGDNLSLYTSPVQIGTSSWTAVSVGYRHSVALKSDGTVWTWGRNVEGQLCQGDTISRSSPVQIGTSSWNSAIAKVNHTILVNEYGELWGCGDNGIGQLGQSDLIHRSSPVIIGSTNLFKNISSVSTGLNHTHIIRNDGSMWSCGINTTGQLGQGDLVHRSSPVQVGTSSWSSVSTGFDHSLSIKSDGTLWAWGTNVNGQLGQGDLVHRSSPVQIGTSSWSFVSVGNKYSTAVRSDGTLWAWGSNGYGQLATGRTSQSIQKSPVSVGTYTPIVIPNTTTTNNIWRSIHIGFSFSMGIKSDGSLWSWGYNNWGQLGLGDQVNRSSPVQIGTSSWSFVSTPNGTYYVLALKPDGTLWAWGNNAFGQLGQSNITNYSSPVQVGTSSWTFISAADTYSSAIKPDGSLWTWGYNLYGQLGQGDRIHRSSPVQVGTSSWTSISGGSNHNVAIRSNGTLWAWGDNAFGQLGQGNITNYSSPVQVGTSSWSSVSAGFKYTAAIKSNGTLWVWGRNYNGQLGQSNLTSYSSPVQIGTSSWISVSAGTSNSVALRKDGSLWVWGVNNYGQLGLNHTINRSSPVQIGTELYSFAATRSGVSLGIRDNNTIWMWGGISSIGDPSSILGNHLGYDRSSPVQIGTDTNWQRTYAGNHNIWFAKKTDGTFWAIKENISTLSSYNSKDFGVFDNYVDISNQLVEPTYSSQDGLTSFITE